MSSPGSCRGVGAGEGVRDDAGKFACGPFPTLSSAADDQGTGCEGHGFGARKKGRRVCRRAVCLRRPRGASETALGIVPEGSSGIKVQFVVVFLKRLDECPHCGWGGVGPGH